MNENIYYVEYNHNDLMEWYTNSHYDDIVTAYENGYLIIGRCFFKDKIIFLNMNELSESQIDFVHTEIGKDYVKVIRLCHLRSDDIIETQVVLNSD